MRRIKRHFAVLIKQHKEAYRDGGKKLKVNISSASAKLRSRVTVHATFPNDVKTCGISMTRDQGIELATYILAVAQAENATGLILIHFTGHMSENAVTIIRRIT